jgi:hypothetical protein
MTQLSAGEFLDKITNSMVESCVMNPQQELVLTVADDDETYVGPDPVMTGYVHYMQFLGLVEQLTGFRTFVRSYLQDRLR